MFGIEERAAPSLRLPWGDGLVDCSVATLYYPSSWDSVGADELAFLLPSLCHSARQAGNPDARMARFFQDALAARIEELVRRADAEAPGRGTDALARIRAARVVATIATDSAHTEGALAWQQLYCRSGRALPLDDTGWTFELCVLAALDRAVATLSGAVPTATSRELLAEALVTSIHSGVNAAYAYPALGHVHELMGVGVWLGHLVRGRSALMPHFVAERLIEEFGRAPAHAQNYMEPTRALIVYYAAEAAGVRRLLRAAKRVFKTGRPALVRPGNPEQVNRLPTPFWDAALTKLIGTHLDYAT